MFRHLLRTVSTVGWLTLLLNTAAEAQGRVFANHDEWTLSSVGRGQAGLANVTTFTRNVTSWLTGGTSGSVLIVSNNFGWPVAPIAADLSTGGFAFTTTLDNTAGGWANRAAYDAVFIDATALTFLTNQQLEDDLRNYVLGGGSVFANLGTGAGGAVAEAARMNGFLGYFGLQAAPVYNGLSGVISAVGYDAQGPFGAGLFSGVTQLYQQNGSDISSGGPNTAGYTTQLFGGTLYGAAALVQSVPEPGSFMLLLVGFAGLGVVARRRA